jgi:hypothetical protein
MVVVTLKRMPRELRLTVSDDGKGFDPRRSDLAWRPVGRYLRATARRQVGAGERNTGTIVCLTLPSREARTIYAREGYREKEGL